MALTPEAAEPLATQPRPLAWWQEGPDPRGIRAWEVGGWLLLLVWVWVSRLSVAPDILYEWDSANYALGVQEFDVFEHQPHPPGYPIYTMALRVLGLLSSSEILPFLMLSGLFSSAILLGMGWMVRRSAGPLAALAASAAFSVCPQFWHQGAVSTAYVAECFCSVGCMVVALAMARRRLSAPMAALAVAMLLGIRPSGLISFLPVLLLALALVRPGPRLLLTSGATFAAGCALWFGPLVLFGGGWDRYWASTAALYEWQRTASGLLASSRNAAVLLRFLLDGVNLLWPALLLNLSLAIVCGAASIRTTVLMLAWFVPGTLIYVFYHLAKSGYVLTLAPVAFVAIAISFGAAWSRLRRTWARIATLGANGTLLVAYLAVNVAGFYLAVPAQMLGMPDTSIALPRRVHLLGDYGLLGLRYRTYAQSRVRAIVHAMDPKQDLAVFLFGSHELHRIDSFYHPDQWRVAVSVGHGQVLMTPATEEHPASFGQFQTIILKPSKSPIQSTITCIHAFDQTLLLVMGRRELVVHLPRTPRRVVVFYPAPYSRLAIGRGVQLRGPLRVGRLFRGAELDPVGLRAATEAPRPSAQVLAQACTRLGLREASSKTESARGHAFELLLGGSEPESR